MRPLLRLSRPISHRDEKEKDSQYKYEHVCGHEKIVLRTLFDRCTTIKCGSGGISAVRHIL
jgi:hypothetical protein